MTAKDRKPAVSAVDAHSVARGVSRLARAAQYGLVELDLSLSQYRLLSYITDDSLGVTHLAAMLAVTTPSVTSVIDGLVARRLIKRSADKTDGRRTVLQLTAQGRKVFRLASEAISQSVIDISGTLPSGMDPIQATNDLGAWGQAYTDYRRVQLLMRASPVID